MKQLFMITAVIFILLINLPLALGEEIITGRLSGYGKDFVVVDGKKIGLCDGYKVSDPVDDEENNSIDGLIAVETVAVTLKNNCAAEIKPVVVRN